MNRKIALPIIIIAALFGILLIINFVLPNIELPNLGRENDDQAQEQILLNEVIITEEGFSPISITIKKGETVRFTNQSGELASINSNPYPANNLYKFLNLGELPDGSATQVDFQEVGSYGYHNHLNPDQQGTVVVQ